MEQSIRIVGDNYNKALLEAAIKMVFLLYANSKYGIRYWGEKDKTLYFRSYEKTEKCPNTLPCEHSVEMLTLICEKWLSQFKAKEGCGDGTYTAGWTLEADQFSIDYDFKISFTTLYYGK